MIFWNRISAFCVAVWWWRKPNYPAYMGFDSGFIWAYLYGIGFVCFFCFSLCRHRGGSGLAVSVSSIDWTIISVYMVNGTGNTNQKHLYSLPDIVELWLLSHIAASARWTFVSFSWQKKLYFSFDVIFDPLISQRSFGQVNSDIF